VSSVEINDDKNMFFLFFYFETSSENKRMEMGKNKCASGTDALQNKGPNGI
jgi:hypothetical protein